MMMSKVLVAYFSAGGVTERLARKLAGGIGADLYKICPAVPYSTADLDWTNSRSRSSVEMNDKSYRPEIAGRAENMEQYDLTGKKVIPFATSGSSGMGNTCRELAPSCPGAVLKEGKRFPANAGEDELKQWAENMMEG